MFIGNIVLDHVEGEENRFILRSPFMYISKRHGIQIRVPPGIVTDGASTPRLLWFLFPPASGRYLEAAVLHDALYSSKVLPRKVADDIFLEAMEELGVPPWKRYLLYWAVRLFGGRAWARKRERTTVVIDQTTRKE